MSSRFVNELLSKIETTPKERLKEELTSLVEYHTELQDTEDQRCLEKITLVTADMVFGKDVKHSIFGSGIWNGLMLWLQLVLHPGRSLDKAGASALIVLAHRLREDEDLLTRCKKSIKE